MRAKYVMSEVFLGLWRNISMTIAMMITMTVTLSMLGAGLLLYNQVEVIEEYYQTNLEVVIYLEREISQEQIDQIESDLLSNDLVSQVQFESQEEAWKRFQETFEESPDLVASVDPSVLPPAFRVKMKNIDDADQLIAEYTEREGVSQATNQRRSSSRSSTSSAARSAWRSARRRSWAWPRSCWWPTPSRSQRIRGGGRWRS
ncbi:hypothetical protein GCM10029992_65990 [Glycomyces albus]